MIRVLWVEMLLYPSLVQNNLWRITKLFPLKIQQHGIKSSYVCMYFLLCKREIRGKWYNVSDDNQRSCWLARNLSISVGARTLNETGKGELCGEIQE